MKKGAISAASTDWPPAQPWVTSDLDLAAYLVLEGCCIHQIEPPAPQSPRRYCSVIFNHSDVLEQLVARWKSRGPLRGELREYARIRQGIYRSAKSIGDIVGGRR